MVRPPDPRFRDDRTAVAEGLAARARREADERDLALINAHAEQLNAEAEDVLKYQVDL